MGTLLATSPPSSSNHAKASWRACTATCSRIRIASSLSTRKKSAVLWTSWPCTACRRYSPTKLFTFLTTINFFYNKVFSEPISARQHGPLSNKFSTCAQLNEIHVPAKYHYLVTPGVVLGNQKRIPRKPQQCRLHFTSVVLSCGHLSPNFTAYFPKLCITDYQVQ